MKGTIVFGVIGYIFVLQGVNTDDGEYCYKSENGRIVCDFVLPRREAKRVGATEHVNVGDGKTLRIQTITTEPGLFGISSFLSEMESEHLIQLAKEKGMVPFTTTVFSPKVRRGITVLDYDNNRKLTVSEMRMTVEINYLSYLEDEEIKEMFKVLDLDTDGDQLISREELEKISTIRLSEYVRSVVRQNPEKQAMIRKQVTLSPSTDEILNNIKERVMKVTGLPKVITDNIEIHIIKYDVGGHAIGHYVSSELPPFVNKRRAIPCCNKDRIVQCRNCRFVTFLVDLNDVIEGGSTAFPIADGNDTITHQDIVVNRVLNIRKYCDKVKVNVKAKRGQALMWYNHFVNETTGWLGLLDTYLLHGSCPVIKGEKWVAYFWIRLTDDIEVDFGYPQNPVTGDDTNTKTDSNTASDAEKDSVKTDDKNDTKTKHDTESKTEL